MRLISLSAAALVRWCGVLGRSLLVIFSRVCLIATFGVAVLLASFGLVCVMAKAPGLVVLVALLAIVFARRRFLGGRWAFGTGRQATPVELARAGTFSFGPGLLIGKAVGPRLIDAVRLLMRLPLRCSEVACRVFLQSLFGRRNGLWARLQGGTHAVAFGPTGSGKGSGLVVTNLLTHPGSVVVIDPKGENAKLTAEYRRRHFGHEIVLLDPYRIVTDSPDTFNVLDGIDRNSPQALDQTLSVAEALVVRNGEEKEPHWCDSAELFIWAIISLVVQEADPEARNLETVARILADFRKLDAAV
jgi:type IV secretion system protein VirD4